MKDKVVIQSVGSRLVVVPVLSTLQHFDNFFIIPHRVRLFMVLQECRSVKGNCHLLGHLNDNALILKQNPHYLPCCVIYTFHGHAFHSSVHCTYQWIFSWCFCNNSTPCLNVQCSVWFWMWLCVTVAPGLFALCCFMMVLSRLWLCLYMYIIQV